MLTLELPKEVEELSNQIALLPLASQAALSCALSEVRSSASRRVRIMKTVQESLTHIRLDMKYLMFDLHATRNERDEALGV